MLKDLFQEISTGQMGRVLFASYLAATFALFLSLSFLLVGVVGSISVVLEALVGGRSRLLYVFWVFALPFMATFVFVWANLHAKRARDIGLPGWTTVLVLTLIGYAAGYFLPNSVVRLIGLAIFATLALVPSDTVRRMVAG